MTDNFGGGIALEPTPNIGPEWDLVVDNSGDIKTVTGEEELRKDVAYATAVRVAPELGNRVEPVVLNRIKARTRTALNDEDRINSVVIIEIAEIDDGAEVVARVRASDSDTFELVFEL